MYSTINQTESNHAHWFMDCNSDMGEKARKCRKNKMMMIAIKILLIVFYCYLTESSFFLGFVTLLSQLTKVGDVTKELFLSKIIIPDFCYLFTCVHIK